MPSATFFLTFLRTRVLVLAMSQIPSIKLLLSASDGLTRTLTSTSVCAGALTAARQTATMTQATIATQIHQALDIHGDFTTQITFNREFANLITQLLHIGVTNVFDFGCCLNTS